MCCSPYTIKPRVVRLWATIKASLAILLLFELLQPLIHCKILPSQLGSPHQAHQRNRHHRIPLLPQLQLHSQVLVEASQLAQVHWGRVKLQKKRLRASKRKIASILLQYLLLLLLKKGPKHQKHKQLIKLDQNSLSFRSLSQYHLRPHGQYLLCPLKQSLLLQRILLQLHSPTRPLIAGLMLLQVKSEQVRYLA